MNKQVLVNKAGLASINESAAEIHALLDLISEGSKHEVLGNASGIEHVFASVAKLALSLTNGIFTLVEESAEPNKENISAKSISYKDFSNQTTKALLAKYSTEIYSVFTLLQSVRGEVNSDPNGDPDLKIDSLLIAAQFVSSVLGGQVGRFSRRGLRMINPKLNAYAIDGAALVPTTNHNQSLTLNILTCDSVENKAAADITTTHKAPAKRSYRVIDRRALKFAQFYASIQTSEWSWENAVHYLRLAYGFESESPEDLMLLGGGADGCLKKSQSKLAPTSQAASAYTLRTAC